jgi:hypothetical protein
VKLLTPRDLALRWSLSEKTLANWRAEYRGPKFLKLGGRVRYREEVIEAIERDNLLQGERRNGNTATVHAETDVAGLREDHSEGEGD